MANLFINIPVPAANGAGAAVDVSTLGLTKSFVIGGGFHASVNVEYSTDAGLSWATLATFHQAGNLTIDVACAFIRAVTANYVSGAPNLDVGATDAGTAVVTLTADGASVDVSALPEYKTVVVPPGFIGRVEASEDGVSWAQIFSFAVSQPTGQSRGFVAQFARVIGAVNGVAVDVVIAGAANAGGGGGGASTDGGEAGVTGAGTVLDPFVPVGGPFRPVTDIFVMDDYLVSYGPQPAGVSTTLGVGYTSILKTAGGVAQFSCNLAAGPFGPGAGSMQGVMDLQLIGAGANQFITATQFRPGDDSGTAIDMSLLKATWDLWMSARVSFEGTGNFETQQLAWAGFWSQIDQPSFNLANREGAYFHPKDNGSQVNWFARYRIFDDSGVVTADVDTGVRVGFTAAHPTDGRAAQNLLVRMQGPAATASLTMAIDGVTVVGPIPLVNPVSRFTPMCALESIAAAQSNTMYVDWMLWGIHGRTV